MAMGRSPSRNTNLPPGMRARHRKSGVYYFYDAGGTPRKEISLGSDYVLAVQKWSELQKSPIPEASNPTFKMAWDKFLRDELSKRSSQTQKDYIKCGNNLLKFFNDPPATLDSIEPIHIRQYLDYRGKEATTRANRERALISLIWNHARSWGYTNKANPCAGIKGFKETPRDVYIEDNVYNAVYEFADQPTKDAMDLSYLTAQRPADSVKMSEMDIVDNAIFVKQNKTNKRIRISVTGELENLIKRIKTRKKSFKVFSLALIVDEYGKPLSQRAIWERFDKARAKAITDNPKLAEKIQEFQWRDLRAKGGTDKASTTDMRQAQKLLGHANVSMTERYVRAKIGEKVEPTK